VIHHYGPYYGPYSFELNNLMESLNQQGILRITREPDGYGYEVASGPVSPTTSAGVLEDPVGRLTKALAGLTAAQLELFATAYYVVRRYGDADIQSNQARIRELKPRFSAPEVAATIQRSKEIALSLTT